MSLTVHRTARPHSAAMPAITAAVARASSASPTRPPPPATTSMWIAPAPPAIAPLITEAATRPPEGAVPVASRRARRRRSAGDQARIGRHHGDPDVAHLAHEARQAAGASGSRGSPPACRRRPPVWAEAAAAQAGDAHAERGRQRRGDQGGGVPHPAGRLRVAGRAEGAELQAVARGHQGPRQGGGLIGAQAAQAGHHAPRRHQGVGGGAVEPRAHERLDALRIDGLGAPAALDELDGGERGGHGRPGLYARPRRW